MEYTRSSASEPVIIPSAPPADPTVAGLEGNYRVVRLLGRGTMASVYLAEQVSMARLVALKILSSDLSENPAFVERFMREAKASARLNHPNIVSAIDFGEFDSRFFLAMEFIDGDPLNAILSHDGALDELQVITIGQQVLAALSHALGHNVIHLDIKPANIMICKNGVAKLTDFGLAMILDSPETEGSRRAVGTPYYMAPEQVEGGSLDWRSDQFSLGASLYEAVTGQKPFQGNSVSEILVKRFFEKPEPAWKAGQKKISMGFSAILSKMMSRSPEGRYQSFADLESDLARVKAGKKPTVARMSSTSVMFAPGAAAWDTLGYTKVMERVDRIIRRRRWNWILYSSLLFLAMLAGYAAVRARDLVGPVPPRYVDHTALHQAELVQPHKGETVRDLWVGAVRSMMRAEKNPTQENYRRAIYGFRILSTSREFRDTAYGLAAGRRADAMLEELHRMGGSYPGDGKTIEF
ncbi:MAG: serine/threonine protein kinase [Planctomycetes bacterium]|nr:serine/threonine protein kinase [Planctomycetota bacterium]